MKLSIIVLISLVGNAVLIGAFVVKPVLAPPAIRDFFHLGSRASPASTASAAADKKNAASSALRGKTLTADADQAKLWSTLHAPDLAALVAQLRAAGFPATIVRAIVDAEVESRFAPRIKELTRSAQETPYWKPDPSYYTGNSKVFEEINQIYRERSRLLRSLLGQDALAYGGVDVSVAQRRQYGDLPQAKIDLVQRINDDYAEMTSQVRTAMQGITLPEDREKLALLEREKRADLAGVLTPEELADYEMKTSMTTSRARTALTIMDANEAEFRAIYQAQQKFSDVLNPVGGIGGMMTQEMSEKRREVQKLANDQIKAALGEERFAQYQRATNSEFQQLYRLGQRENLPTDTLVRAFDVRGPTAEASMTIYNNPTMSVDDKRTALKNLADTARTKILSTLGPGVGPAYVENTRWIGYIEQGGAVSLTPEGGISYRRLPTPPAPGTPRPKN